MTEPPDVRKLPGLVATVCTTGHVLPAFSECREEMRSYNDRNGFSVEYRFFDAKLVEAGRDMAVRHALDVGYAWVLQIDADAAPFAPNALEVLLTTAFVTHPDADVVGAYCQLKSPVPLPTIDTGTGTWEEHYPGEGVLPVIRTGAHFLLAKTIAFTKFGPPWFRTRQMQQPIDAFAEVDNFARCQLDGRNPFAVCRTCGPEWVGLLQSAREVVKQNPDHVGEDSGFCDRLMAVGGRIYVNTDLVAGHMDTKVITPTELREALAEQQLMLRKHAGVFE